MSPALLDALARKQLEAIPVVLGPRDQRNRSVFWTVGLRNACEDLIGGTVRHRSILSYAEQLNQMVVDFVSGRPLAGGLTRCDPPKGEGIWKIHTPDLRLFGWCDCPQVLVLAEVELKANLARPGSPTYPELARRAAATRRRLGFGDWHVGDIRTAFPASC